MRAPAAEAAFAMAHEIERLLATPTTRPSLFERSGMGETGLLRALAPGVVSVRAVPVRTAAVLARGASPHEAPRIAARSIAEHRRPGMRLARPEPPGAAARLADGELRSRP